MIYGVFIVHGHRVGKTALINEVLQGKAYDIFTTLNAS